MYISRVRLTNVKVFEHLDLSLDRGDGAFAGWTVFTGDNASGKTTLLRAIALGLEQQIVGPRGHVGWCRFGETSGRMELCCVATERDDAITAEKDKLQAFVNFDDRSISYSGLPLLGPMNSRGFFSCGYGPFRRMSGYSDELANYMMLSKEYERFVTLFVEGAALRETDKWLRLLKHRQLENDQQSAKQLAIVIDLLNSGMLPSGFSVGGVDSDGVILNNPEGQKVAWSDMSDGHRTVVALLVDIVRHMIGVYGARGLVKRSRNGTLHIARSGVVLIDEVDAHLHPEWQREIGFWLKRHFPKVQFLVTSHSPIICQAADKRGIIVLPEPGSGKPARVLSEEERLRVIASGPNQILRIAYDLEHTRSPLAVENRAEFARLTAKKRSGARLTRRELAQLQELLPFAESESE